MDGTWNAVVGARPLKAEIVSSDKNMISGEDPVTEAEDFGAYVAGKLTFGSNMRGSAEYRKQIAAVLVRRAMLAAGKDA